MFRPGCGSTQPQLLDDTAMAVPISRLKMVSGSKAKPRAPASAFRSRAAGAVLPTPKLKQPKAPPKLLVGSTMKPGAKQEVDEDDVSEEMLDMAYTR